MLRKPGRSLPWRANKRRTLPPARVRSEKGFQLVECLVGLLISSVVMAAVMPDLLQMQRMSIDSRNQTIASDIAQEVMDNARNMSWDDLLANAGTHNLTVNLSSGSVTDSFFPRPLQLDMGNLVYSSASQKNLFHADQTEGGSVTATITDNGDGTATVSVTVSWIQQTGSKTMTAKTVISQTGIHA